MVNIGIDWKKIQRGLFKPCDVAGPVIKITESREYVDFLRLRAILREIWARIGWKRQSFVVLVLAVVRSTLKWRSNEDTPAFRGILTAVKRMTEHTGEKGVLLNLRHEFESDLGRGQTT